MTTGLSDAAVTWAQKFTGVPIVIKATEPEEDDVRGFSSPAANKDGGPPPEITEEYVRGYLFHYDYLPVKDGSDFSAGNCLFSGGTAAIADVVKWLEKRAVADGYAPNASFEQQIAKAVYEERQHAQGMGSQTADKYTAGGDIRFLLTGIAKSSMQGMLDALEAIRSKQQLNQIQDAVVNGRDASINTPKMRAALLTVQRDLGDDWKKEMEQLSEDDAHVIRQHVLAEMDEGDFSPPAASPTPSAPPGAPKKDDDDVDTTVEVDPAQGKVDTEVQYTIKLKATNDDDPPKIQLLPDVEITVHVGAAGAVSIEGQLNIIKADVKRLLKIGGKIKIEAKVGLSAESNILDAAVGKIAKSLETNIKSEIEITLTKHFSIKFEVDVGVDGKPQGGPGVVWHF